MTYGGESYGEGSYGGDLAVVVDDGLTLTLAGTIAPPATAVSLASDPTVEQPDGWVDDPFDPSHWVYFPSRAPIPRVTITGGPRATAARLTASGAATIGSYDQGAMTFPPGTVVRVSAWVNTYSTSRTAYLGAHWDTELQESPTWTSGPGGEWVYLSVTVTTTEEHPAVWPWFRRVGTGGYTDITGLTVVRVAGPVDLEVAGAIAPPTAAVLLTTPAEDADLDLAGTVAAPTAYVVLSSGTPIVLTGTIARPVAAMVLVADDAPATPPVESDPGTAEDPDVDFDAHHDEWHTWPAPVVRPTAQSWDVAHAWWTDGTTRTEHTARTIRHADRILAGGVDITDINGIPTPCPDYELITPGSYGPGRLVVPGVNPVTDDLTTYEWLTKGSPVMVQRVNAVGDVVATDYRGRVQSWAPDGSDLVVELGGMLAGPAATRWRPRPLQRRREDIGYWTWALLRHLRQPMLPEHGRETGIKAWSSGAAWCWDYLTGLTARAVKRDGTSWMLKYDEAGEVWRLRERDPDHVTATCYPDDGPMKLSATRDMAAEIDEVYATAVRDDGQRIDFEVYPGMVQGDIPAFPGTMTQGDDSDDAKAALYRMVVTGYLDREGPNQALPDWDAEVTEAIEDFQDDLGLDVTGDIDEDTWDALFDVAATGFTLREARILPAARRRAITPKRLSATGNVVATNPDYDPAQARVAVSAVCDMGQGFTGKQVRKFARQELTRGPEWTATLSADTAFIRGEHLPGDPLTSDDVLPGRAIRPGDKVVTPLWQGGVDWWVSGVRVSDAGTKVELLLDTKRRDTLKVWEIIQRNRESRRDPARVWWQGRSSTSLRDTVVEWSRMAGVLGDRVPLPAEQWTVLVVPAGQTGTVASLRLKLRGTTGDGDPTPEFACAVFGDKPGEGWLDGVVPDPLADPGDAAPWYEKAATLDALEGKRLLYAAGTHDDPCGYHPRHKLNAEGEASGAPLTGIHRDDATFAYYCADDPVLYVAIWPTQAAVIDQGRIMWALIEAGT